jgi:hypothetical protein
MDYDMSAGRSPQLHRLCRAKVAMKKMIRRDEKACEKVSKNGRLARNIATAMALLLLNKSVLAFA